MSDSVRDALASSEELPHSGHGDVAATSGAVRAADPLVGSVLVGRYRVDALIGSGGMGSVYRAEHVHMRKTFAIKVLHREMTYLPEVVARFEREAVAAARIEHVHVAAATDFGRLEDGSFYLVLEFVQGHSLGTLLRRDGAISIERSLHIARQIAGALGAAHELGIIHRDLKPDNVMLIERDTDADFVKVLDFGIAKVRVDDSHSDEKLTQMGTVFGTPEYMAPEQAQGAEVDGRADLYTLGMVLYEMLSGTSAFRDDEILVVLTRQLTQDPPPLPAAVPKPIADLVLKLLKKNPAERYQSAREVIQAIDLLMGEATTAPMSVAAGSGRGYLAATVPSVAGEGLLQPLANGAVSTAGNVFDRVSEVVRSTLPFFKRRVHIKGRSLPMWMIGAFASVFGAVGGAVALNAGPSVESTAPKENPSIVSRIVEAARSSDAELKELLVRARTGEREALAKLQARPDWRRSDDEWKALGRGYLQTGNYKNSLSAYSAALKKKPELAEDANVIRDVRRMLEKPEAADAALALAAGPMSRAGADLLYDVWTRLKSDPKRADFAKQIKDKLVSAALRAKASPALLVALDLTAAKGCNAYKQLLPRAIEYADARSLTTLRKLRARRGCGILSLGDCYSCLRGNDKVSEAISATETRALPPLDGLPPL